MNEEASRGFNSYRSRSGKYRHVTQGPKSPSFQINAALSGRTPVLVYHYIAVEAPRGSIWVLSVLSLIVGARKIPLRAGKRRVLSFRHNEHVIDTSQRDIH